MSKGKTRQRHNNIPEAKAGHNGTAAPPYGRRVWLLVRCDNVLYGAWQSRHDAIGAAVSLNNAKWEWFEPIAVPAGAVPILDIRDV